MAVKDEIESALHAAFTVETLAVADVSEAHRGHAGFREGGRRISTWRLRRRNLRG